MARRHRRKTIHAVSKRRSRRRAMAARRGGGKSRLPMGTYREVM